MNLIKMGFDGGAAGVAGTAAADGGGGGGALTAGAAVATVPGSGLRAGLGTASGVAGSCFTGKPALEAGTGVGPRALEGSGLWDWPGPGVADPRGTDALDEFECGVEAFLGGVKPPRGVPAARIESPSAAVPGDGVRYVSSQRLARGLSLC